MKLSTLVMNKQIKRSDIEEWTLDRIIPYEHNAKLHPDSHVDQIAASIEEFTFLDPIAVDEKGEIIEGHGRLLAAKQRGDVTIPVIQITGLTEAQKVAYRLAHNKLTMHTGFDPELLKIDFEFLKGEDFDLGLTGFESVELEFLNESGGGNGSSSGGSDNDEFEEVESRVKPNEVWQLGRHFLSCADCTVEENVRKLLGFVGGRSPDMCFSDPPYGMNFDPTKDRTKPFGSASSQGKKPIKSISRPPVIGDNSTDTAIAAYKIYKNIASVHIWWGANYYAHALPPSSCWIVWDKENSGDFADCELAWTNQKSAVRIFRHMWNGALKDSEKGERRVHATQKPIALFRFVAEKYGKPNDLIIDPFLGSGISILGAEEMECDRVTCGFEASADYCEIICQRFEKMGGDRPKRVGTL